MRIAIVEDEAVVARRLARMVRAMVAGAEVETASTLAEALELARTRGFEVLLLDLNLGGRDGFGLLETAVATPFRAIVVSAHHDEALRAFDYGVVDFVPKPWSAERLRKALDRAMAGGESGAPRLAVRKGREVWTIPVTRVVLVTGADDYSRLHLDDGSVHLHEKSLSQLQAILPQGFLRIHRSYIVDGARVRALRTAPGGRLEAVLVDGRAVPVGRVYREAVRSRLLPPRPPGASSGPAPLP